MKVTSSANRFNIALRFLSTKKTIGCLTALTMCLNGGLLVSVEAKTRAEDKSHKAKKARYHQSRKKHISRLPFQKKEKEDSEETGKKKASKGDKENSKKTKQDKNEEVQLDEVDVIEVDEDANGKEESKSESTEKKDESKDAEKVVEEPKLLPDQALISVLNDISKSLAKVGKDIAVNDPREQQIIDLARKILAKSLAGEGVEADRILEPEHEENAKATMIVEAWSSGDIKVDDGLNGSVACVWGKRVDGLVNVTIAGESQTAKTDDGKPVGKFIVVISGKSPVKKGFDIQSQSDVTFWFGEVGDIDVDSACLKKTESKEEKGEEEEDTDKKASAEKKVNPVKKKPLVTLAPILTDRKREYLALYAIYKDQQDKLAREEEEEEKEKSDLTEPDKVARASQKPAAPYYPEEVEIIEVEEIDVPAKPTEKERSILSDYDFIQETNIKTTKPKVKRKKRTTRTIRRYPRRYKVAQKPVSQENPSEDVLNESKAERDSEVDSKTDETSNEKLAESNEEKVVRDDEPAEKKIAKEDEPDTGDVDDQDKPDDSDKVAKKTESDKEDSKTVAESEKKNGDQSRIASVTKIAPKGSSPSPATVNSRRWESPQTTYQTRQPSLGATVVYPARAIAGKFLTVAVIDTEGKPEPSVELSFNGATLSTDQNGQAMFMVPEDATPGRTLHISLAARPELSPGVIEVLQPLFTTTEKLAPSIDRASKLVPSSDVLVIDGHDFIGMAKNNRVMIDSNQEAKVIASSPVQLKLKLSEDLKAGKHKANIANTALRSNPVEFEYIKAQIVEDKKIKKKGTGDLIVQIQGTSKPVHVRIVNKTPDVMKINKGNELIVTTSGGSNNTSKIDVKRLKKGDYKIDARIEI